MCCMGTGDINVLLDLHSPTSKDLWRFHEPADAYYVSAVEAAKGYLCL